MTSTLDWNTRISSHAVQRTNVFDMGDFRQSRSISVSWRRSLRDELAIAVADAENDNINRFSALRAEEFIGSLPLQPPIDLPSISVEENGNILLEWYKKPAGEEATIFSVIFAKENYIFSLLQNGVHAGYGALNYSIISLDMILNQIQKNFGVLSYARSKA